MAKFHQWFQTLALPFVELSFHIYFGLRVIGRENLPEGGCVVCPNHTQNSDPPIAATAISNRHKMMCMAKKELFAIKGLGPLITWLGAFPVDRSRADLTAIKTALKTVKDGKKLIIFPQGTRGAGEDEAKDGAAMLAMKTKAPIVPMYISENKKFRSHVTVIIGKPFLPDADSKDYSALSREILHRIYALRPEEDT